MFYSQCWEYDGCKNPKGYGNYRGRMANRVAYEVLVGPVDSSLQMDHLCRNKACYNPTHLEPVTGAENMRRRREANTHCPQGHRMVAGLVYENGGRRWCGVCRRLRGRDWMRRHRAA